MATDRTGVLAAVAVLRRGGLVAFPTETVYGLGAAAEDAHAVRRLFTAKGRPADHPVIVHVGGVGDLDRYCDRVPAVARRLTEALWPGPLTVVVPRNHRLSPEVAGGMATVGVRSPAHPVAGALLEAFGAGIAAPSANRFGRLSPTTAAAVLEELGDRVDLVLDGGPCTVGVESTIVDCSGREPLVLRVGGVPAEVLADVIGAPVAVADRVGGAPGTLPAHYAPAAHVVVTGSHGLGEVVAEQGGPVAVLWPGNDRPPSVDRTDGVDVVLMGDADAYAHDLFTTLRRLDAQGVAVVVAVPPDGDGIAAAVRDRLLRAATAASG